MNFTRFDGKMDRYLKLRAENPIPDGDKPENEKTTLRYMRPEKVKFSSVGENKEYFLHPDKANNMTRKGLIDFKPKPEQTRIPFDPNIRHRLPTIPNHLTYRYLYGHMPQGEAQSCYVAVNHKGTTYHLFNAKHIPLGRMCVMISTFIRGKHKPGYEQNNYKNADKCIVVNMKDPMLTGKKRQTKLYRHHTGYPGGLKEIPFKDMVERKPDQILVRTLLGMLPKNELRHQMIKENVIIYAEPYHNFGKILPQFVPPLPRDINEDINFDATAESGSKILYASDPSKLPEEFSHLPLDLDDSVEIPITLRTKTHSQPR